ncbi:hypothetical protein LCGC14_2252430 [marine sediment metagenome]|uniref:Uncharacterized protein n=1 Tax=marine sediment metagenome TaxID=412755 RepID=A0A0F9FEL4_9ZZZZ
MNNKKLSKDSLHLLHSDKLIMDILNASNKYLEEHVEIREKIEEYNWIFRSLFELIPETVENFWSGHVFPIAEAEYEQVDPVKRGSSEYDETGVENIFYTAILFFDDEKSPVTVVVEVVVVPSL